jgi:hypothetical protein
VLVPLLHKEAEYANLQAKLLSVKKLKKYQRKCYQKAQQKIFYLWDRYTASEMSTSSFLREAGHLYSPSFSDL